MKKKIIRILIIILILLWMYLVFAFSNDDGKTSSGLSTKVANFFSNDKYILAFLEPVIRKLAHLTEYIVGGFLFYRLLLTFNINPKKQVIFAVILGILYAVSDEFHQLFVPGRTSKVTDVMIDSIGVTIGVCFLLLIIKIIEKIKES